MERILSKEEIDALLQLVPKEKKPLKEVKEKKISEYDFKRYIGISREHFPVFKEVHERFDFLIEQLLSTRTGKFVNIKLEGLEIKALGDFITSCSNPSYIVVFKLEPVIGDIFLNIEPALVHALVDITLGGDGHIIRSPPQITLIEQDLMPRNVSEILGYLEQSWNEYMEVSLKIGTEGTNPFMVAPSDSPTPVLLVSFNVIIGEEKKVPPMQMRVGYSGEAARVLGVAALSRKRGRHLSAGAEFQTEASNALRANEVEVSAELGKTRLSVRELLELEIGDVIQLDVDTDGELPLYIGGKRKWLGRPGVYKKHIVVKISRPYEVGGGHDGPETK